MANNNEKNNEQVLEEKNEQVNQSEKNLSFDKLYIDTKIRQFFEDRNRFEKLKSEEVSLEIIRRMIFQKSFLGYIDDSKKPILDFDPHKISANTVLKLTQNTPGENLTFLLPTFSDLSTRNDFLSKPREADLAEGTYINWFLVNFPELLTSVKSKDSIFRGVVINPEEKYCEIAISPEQAQLTMTNISTLPPDIDNVKINNSIDNQVDYDQLKNSLLKVVEADPKIKRVKGFRFINKLSRGIGFIYEYDGIKEYDALVGAASYCSDLTDASMFIWHALANVNDVRFSDFELIMDGKNFVKKQFISNDKDISKENTTKLNKDKPSEIKKESKTKTPIKAKESTTKKVEKKNAK
ncbi:hypothetical protein [Spiroplasma endosymbiont of Aspidapion aeneum]|uniref:hypothetical protein n=1 Tax=Spiroplasma endosymbiont of Aspidapion aeneum TaxID=3066276 RepID=UPI00313C3EDA